MRTMIGKRIGPVPIALVAVLALAAFIAAGLWLTPSGGAQAAFLAPDNQANQHEPPSAITKKGSIPNQTLDVGQPMSAETTATTDAEVVVDLDDYFTIPANVSVDYTFASTNTTSASGLITSSFGTDSGNEITLGAVSAPAKTTVTVTATNSADSTDTATQTFDVTVEENILKMNGVDIDTPNMVIPYGTNVTQVVPVETWGEGACEVVTDGTSLVSRIDDRNTKTTSDDHRYIIDGGPNILVAGGDCTTTGDSVDVVFKNISKDNGSDNTDGTDDDVEAAATSHLVYITGGSKFKKVLPALVSDNDGPKPGLTQEIVSLKAETVDILFNETADEVELTINRSRAVGGVVYLVGYGNVTSTTIGDNRLYEDEPNDTPPDSTFFRANAAFVIKVVFLEGPDQDKSNVGDVTVPKDDTTAMVTVSVADANGHGLAGTFATLTIEGAPDNVVFTNTTEQRQRVKVGADGTAEAQIQGLPETAGFRYTVKAVVSGLADPVTGEVSRIGPVATVTAKAYQCDQTKTDICAAEKKAKVSTLTAASVISPGHKFLIIAEAADAAENKLGGITVSAEQTKPATSTTVTADITAADGTTGSGADDKGVAMLVATVNADEDPTTGMAPSGEYTIEVSHELADDSVVKADPIMVTVSGPAKDYVLTGAEWIALNGEETYTITATDANGNPPVAPIGGICVRVILRSDVATADDLDLPKLVGDSCANTGTNAIKLGADGTATFNVFAPYGAAQGDTGQILLKVSDSTEDRINIGFGIAPRQNNDPTTVGEIDAVTLQMSVTTSATRDVMGIFDDADDDDTLGYTASSDDTSIADATVSDSVVTITAMGEGSTTITVTASDGRGGMDATQTIMVTVNPAPVEPEPDPEPVTMYKVTGDMRAEDGINTYTVTAVDANGEIGAVTDAINAVTVTVRSDDNNAVTLLTSSVMLSDGEGTVSIDVEDDAASDEITIRVYSSDYKIRGEMDVRLGTNMAPMGADIDDLDITVGDEDATVATSFTDADGDDAAITITAMSSDETIASVMVMDGNVMVTAVGAGTATITVTGMDDEMMASEAVTFDVMVEAANLMPVAGTVAPQTVVANRTIDVDSAITDPDDGALTYDDPTSSDAKIATATVDDAGMVTIRGVAVGGATIMVTATDPDGASVTQSIVVTVTAAPPTPNRAPTVMTDAPAMVELAHDGAQNIGVSELFTDSDGSVSIQGAYASDPTVVTVGRDAIHVSLTAASAGTTNVTVTAVDNDGATATHTISVTVMAMPDTSLGMATGLTATGSDGTVTLSWMGGANATRHWIAGVAKNADGTYDYAKNVWMSADDATTGDDGMMTLAITQTSDGMALVNGTQFVFTVAAYNAAEGWGSWVTPFATATPAATPSTTPPEPTIPFPVG